MSEQVPPQQPGKAYLLARIERLERELTELKDQVIAMQPEQANLEGLWSDTEVTDDDIAEAKSSLFRDKEDM